MLVHEGALSPLAQAKQPFVLRDYTSYFEASSRVMTRLSTLRSWQITVLGFLGVSARYVPMSSAIAVSLGIWGLFLALECVDRGSMALINENALKCERRLSPGTMAEFDDNLCHWEFGNRSWSRTSRADRLRHMVSALRSPSVLAWHGMVFVLQAAVLAFVPTGA